MSRTLSIAAAQYPMSEFSGIGEYEAKITRWVEDAVSHGAELLVFPEYGSMELCSIGGRGQDLCAQPMQQGVGLAASPDGHHQGVHDQ